jgi:hypothetical protein
MQIMYFPQIYSYAFSFYILPLVSQIIFRQQLMGTIRWQQFHRNNSVAATRDIHTYLLLCFSVL